LTAPPDMQWEVGGSAALAGDRYRVVGEDANHVPWSDLASKKHAVASHGGGRRTQLRRHLGADDNVVRESLVGVTPWRPAWSLEIDASTSSGR
jgi:hypothetical protein